VQKLQFIVTSESKLECFNTFRNICNNKHPSVRLRYVTALKPVQLPHRFMYVLFDTECTQDLEQRDGYFEQHRTVYVLSKCVHCGKKLWSIILIIKKRQTCSLVLAGPHREHIDYRRQCRIFAGKIYVISDNYSGYDTEICGEVLWN